MLLAVHRSESEKVRRKVRRSSAVDLAVAVNWFLPVGVTVRLLVVARGRLPHGVSRLCTPVFGSPPPPRFSAGESEGVHRMADKNGTSNGSGDHNGDKPKSE
ncbi:hypothetical protein ACFP3U_24915 [Kitasatospora misakiensis]|uniref:Uncharacterized protein n=1 Tax=Kitasatospora misakiensis TaxID=67330 RepID=A0ABW0XA85_9ACTN